MYLRYEFTCWKGKKWGWFQGPKQSLGIPRLRFISRIIHHVRVINPLCAIAVPGVF